MEHIQNTAFNIAPEQLSPHHLPLLVTPSHAASQRQNTGLVLVPTPCSFQPPVTRSPEAELQNQALICTPFSIALPPPSVTVTWTVYLHFSFTLLLLTPP